MSANRIVMRSMSHSPTLLDEPIMSPAIRVACTTASCSANNANPLRACAWNGRQRIRRPGKRKLPAFGMAAGLKRTRARGTGERTRRRGRFSREAGARVPVRWEALGGGDGSPVVRRLKVRSAGGQGDLALSALPSHRSKLSRNWQFWLFLRREHCGRPLTLPPTTGPPA